MSCATNLDKLTLFGMAVPLPLAVSSLLQGLCRQLNDPALLLRADTGPQGKTHQTPGQIFRIGQGAGCSA